MSQQTTRCSSSKNVSRAQRPRKPSLISDSEGSRPTNISSGKQTVSLRWSSRSISSHAGADGQRGFDSVLWRLRQLRRQLSTIFSTNKGPPPADDTDTGQGADVLTTINSQRLNGSTRVLGSSTPVPLCPTTLPTLASPSPSTPNDFVNSLSSTPIGDNDEITSTYTPSTQLPTRSLGSSTLMESSSGTPSVDPSLDTTFTPSFTLESTSIFTIGSSQTLETSFDPWFTDSSSTETPSSSDAPTPRPSTSTPDPTSSPSFTWTTNPSPSNELTSFSPDPFTTFLPSSSSSTFSLSSEPEVDVPVHVPPTASSRRSSSSQAGSITTVSPPQTTVKVTRIYTTTYSEGLKTTVTTVIETGVLRTDVPSTTSGLANNIGAIIGVTTGCLVGLIACIILIFFCCRKHRRGDNEDRLHPQSEWKPPLGDEIETGRGFLYGAALVAARLGRKFSNRSESADGGTYTNHSKNEDGRDGPQHIASNGSGEMAQSPATSLTTPSGGLGYFPGMEQTLKGARSEEDLSLATLHGSSSAHDCPDAPGVAANPVSGSKSPSTMSEGGQYHASSASLLASSHNEGSSVETTQLGGASLARKGISLLGDRPRSSREAKTHSSTPPVSFPVDTDFQVEVTEKGSLRRILNELGGKGKDPIPTSKSIMPSSFSTLTHISNPFDSSESLANTTVVGPTSAQTTVARPLTIHPHSDAFLVPVSPPTPPILSSPQGVTGRDSVASHQPVTSPPAPLWPVFTLPPPPSPTDDSASIMVEGLLHPRVTLMSSGSYQASRTSFDDHQDYSRPISGTLLGHLHQSLVTTERQTSVSSAGSKSIQGL